MSRRSARLLAVGYYAEDRTMSYKETLVKVVRRRRSGDGAQGSAHGSRTGTHHLDTSYCSEDEPEVQGTSRSTQSGSHGNGANVHPTVNKTPLYWRLTLVLLLSFSFWFMMTSQTALTCTFSASDVNILHPNPATMVDPPLQQGFNAEAGGFMTQILQDLEIKLQSVVSKMENRFRRKILKIKAEIDNLSINQRLAAQERSLNQMKLDLDTWIGVVNKPPPAPLGSITAELQDNLDRWFQEKVQSRLGQCCAHPVADKMMDFALESQGGRVLRHLCSPSYQTKAFSLWFLTSYCPQRSPSTVIQGQAELVPGQCWAFVGGTGHMVISLSHPITISHVTLDHIPSYKTPTGHIDSAPKNILVYGMTDCENTEGTLLGNFVYDEDGEPSQTFTLHDQDAGVFKFVRLMIQTNWGHPDHTCLYRFRVHGKIPSH